MLALMQTERLPSTFSTPPVTIRCPLPDMCKGLPSLMDQFSSLPPVPRASFVVFSSKVVPPPMISGWVTNRRPKWLVRPPVVSSTTAPEL